MAVWCEIWLQGSEDDVEHRFRDVAAALNFEVQTRSLRFPERTVLLCRTSREQLVNLIESSPDIAEFRRAKETARFFLELENKDQTDWVNDLRSRLQTNPDATVAVCVLDTGANNGHALLHPILADNDCHAVEPAWGVNDHQGHGTLMCGVAAFGDLAETLQHSHPLRIDHYLESAKILPPRGFNDPDLYGDITIQGIYRATIQAPDRNRIGCMAVTSEDGRDQGRPSSWSAAIDKSEAEIQPYTKKEGRSDYSSKDMHLHRLPWPREVLLALGETPVALRVTLSYFIEPGPGEVGWKDKYRYASYGLRFDLNNTGEDEVQFSKRLNAADREEGERPDSSSGSERWVIGANSRNTGSVHSDIWKGTAADIASCNLIGVYPVIGWWRERAWLGRWGRRARYSLIVSLHTPNESIDIYTPVAVQLGIPVEVTV